MSIYGYNEEYVRKSLTETGYEQGLVDGRRKGKNEGQAETLVKNVDAVMQNLKLNFEKACKAIGITKEDYLDAQSKL